MIILKNLLIIFIVVVILIMALKYIWKSTVKEGFEIKKSTKSQDCDFQAGFKWENYLYLFKGPQVIKYNLETKMREDKDFIKNMFPELDFIDDIDTVFPWNNKVYFFKGDKVAIYNMFTKTQDKIGKITDDFKIELQDKKNQDLFSSDLDSAIPWNKDKVYFFKGDKYLKYDMKDKIVERGYPFDINNPNTVTDWRNLNDHYITNACAGINMNTMPFSDTSEPVAYFFNDKNNHAIYDLKKEDVVEQELDNEVLFPNMT